MIEIVKFQIMEDSRGIWSPFQGDKNGTAQETNTLALSKECEFSSFPGDSPNDSRLCTFSPIISSI